MTAQPFYQLFIDGAWTDGSTGQLMETTNPANGEVWARFACASEADVDRAVRAAARALSDPLWRDMTQTARGKLLYRLADLVEALDRPTAPQMVGVSKEFKLAGAGA
mgnify:CR=1 FL=1